MLNKFLNWLVQKLEKFGYLPTHHLNDPRMEQSDISEFKRRKSYKRRYYTRHGLPYINEEELSERRMKILAKLPIKNKYDDDE